MKNTITTFTVFLIVCAFATAASAGEPKVTLKTDVLSRRMIPNGIPAGKHPVLTNDLRVSFLGDDLKSGIYFGTWLWSGLNDAGLSSDSTDKWDGYAGLFGEIVDGVIVDLSFRYYNLVPFSKAPRGDIIQPNAEIRKRLGSLGRHSLSAYLQFSPHYPAKGGKPEKGILSYAGLRDAWGINEKTRIMQDFAFVHDDGMCGGESGVFVDYKACMSYKLSKKIELNLPQMRVFLPLSHFSDRKTEFLLGAGFKFTF